MSEAVRYEVREGVARITVDNPPVNALVQPVRAGLDAAIARAMDDPEVGAVVIGARGRTFPAGTDVRDFRRDADRPRLDEVCARIEAATKPVIAAIHGTALGGGLELALACHFRLALDGTQFGLPDVALGVVPAAGGTQRLPRLVGAARALDMLLSARPVTADAAETIGLVDKVIHKNLRRAAFGTARNMAQSGRAPRPTGGRTDGFGDPKAYLAAVRARRVALAGDPRVAAHAVVDLVEAALLLPIAAGLEKERVTRADLVDSPQARGLRHAFLAERRSARVPALTDAATRPVESVAVLGHGDAAAGVVRACLAGGYPVTVLEEDEASRLAVRTRIVAGLAREVEAGRLAPETRDARLDRLAMTGDVAVLAAVDLVIEAVGERLETQRAAFARAGAAAREGAVLATVSGRADLTVLARAAGRPGDVMALHMVTPAHRTRLVEVAVAEPEAADLAATGIALARRLGKVPVLAADVPGYITGTLVGALFAAGEALVLAGSDPAEVDAALEEAGFAAGPFRMADEMRLPAVPLPGAESELSVRMRHAGLTGRTEGQGYYDYGDDGRATGPSAKALRLVATLRNERGSDAEAPRPDPDEIVRRCLLAMANAGARLLAAGVAARSLDVDVAALHGLGVPRWLGGPMEAADQIGLLHARNLMRDWAGEGALARVVWEPAEMIGEMVRTSRSFGSLND